MAILLKASRPTSMTNRQQLPGHLDALGQLLRASHCQIYSSG
jgi:hypothetical protein